MSTMWKNTLVWLGLAEEYEDEYVDVTDEPAPRRGGAPGYGDTSNVRRIGPSGASETRDEPRTPTAVRSVQTTTVHLTEPTTFNDIEEIGERFRNGIPVIMNLAGASESVAKRLLDFASGLIFGLDGRIERVGDRVFLLTPLGVEVSTEERRKLSERGFFNQA